MNINVAVRDFLDPDRNGAFAGYSMSCVDDSERFQLRIIGGKVARLLCLR